MDSLINFFAQLDVPPGLVAALAAFTVGYALYEFLIKRRVQASQAEKQLRGYLDEAVDEDAYTDPEIDSWAYKFQVAGITRAFARSVKPEQAKTYLYGASGLLAAVAFLAANAFALPGIVALGAGGFAAAAPALYLNGKVKARARRMEKELPMALRRIATHIRIHPDVAETLTAVAETLDEDSPLGAELRRTARDLRTNGTRALVEMEARSQLVSPSLATVAFQLQRYAERGSGSFSEAFTSAAENLHKILEGRGKAEAKSSEAMGAIQIIPAMLALVMLYFMNEPSMRGTFQMPVVQLFLVALAGWMGLGYWFMKGMIEEIG
ncbi:MAG: type II secretion system F family protein [Anaerolineae bacterium]|nr:type II secretion system F family protein [Anaerolineae bacterium]